MTMLGGFHEGGEPLPGFHEGGEGITVSGGSGSLTIGTTPIVSGATGRIPFEGAGAVLDDDASFVWDDVDKQLVLGNGTAAKPSLILGDDTTGLFRSALNVLAIATAGVARWNVNAAGHLLAATDASFDIGATGATRPRDAFLSGHVLPGNGLVGSPAHAFDADPDTGFYSIAGNQLGLALGGVLNASWGVAGPDLDLVVGMGRAYMDSRVTDVATFSHRDQTGTQAYALYQSAAGSTRINSPSAGSLTLRNNDTTKMTISSVGLGFFATSPVALQTGPALNVTNNVTAGGTDGTIANYTDLTIYANDAAAIRNDLYQLARLQKMCSDALRAYGLLT